MIINNDDKNIPMPQGINPLQKGKKINTSDVAHAKKNNSSMKQKEVRAKEPTLTEKYINRTVHLEIDHESHNVIVKVVDKNTGEVIRQIPPEELVALAKKIKDGKGTLFNKEA